MLKSLQFNETKWFLRATLYDMIEDVFLLYFISKIHRNFLENEFTGAKKLGKIFNLDYKFNENDFNH